MTLPRLCIIEGPTGVGKSTIIRWLVQERERDYSVMHFPKPPANAKLLWWYSRLFRPQKGDTHPVCRIADRWFPSNQVYGDQKKLSEAACHTLEVYALSVYNLSVSAVTLVASPDTLKARCLARGDKPSSKPYESQLVTLCRRYSHKYYSRIPHTFVKTDNLTEDQVYDRVRYALENKQR